MNEELMRSFGVAPVHLPILRLTDARGEVARLVARGLWIIGANGRVDLSFHHRQHLIVDRSEYFSPPRWEVAPALERLDAALINDSAYFILAWGQLEAELNAASEAAVRSRRSSIRWDERRAWDAHDPDNMRARFEDRAALVLDRFNTLSDAFKRTIQYYGMRKSIAHGTGVASGIDVAAAIRDFYQIAR